MRLLCIADPRAYRGGATDVPLGYAQLAAHPDVELFHAEPRALMQKGGRIPALRVPAGFEPEHFEGLDPGKAIPLPATEFDLAFCRTLKPFPQGYLDSLVAWSRALPFVNDPAGIRRQLDPAFLLEAAGPFLPEFLRTNDPGELASFLAEYGSVVAKRANSCGGRGVYRVTRKGQGPIYTDHAIEGESTHPDEAALVAHVAGAEREPLLWMRFLPRVVEGDKRVVVVDGVAVGAYLRRSPRGSWVQNVSQGARCEPALLTDDDRAVVAATCNVYTEAGIRLLGYDLIRDVESTWRVSEINAGNVGGLFRLESLGVPGISDRFVAFLERRTLEHRTLQRQTLAQRTQQQ